MFTKQGSIVLRVVCILFTVIFAVVLLTSDLLRLKHSIAAQLGLPAPGQMIGLTADKNTPCLTGLKLRTYFPGTMSLAIKVPVLDSFSSAPSTL